MAPDALELLYVITPHKDIINDHGGGTIQMPRHRKPEKKPIDRYDHNEASRANNPPAGLVTPEVDRDAGKRTYAYDPHYRIKYGSNFQPFVNKPDVKDGKNEDPMQEPEIIKAFLGYVGAWI